MTRRSPDDPAFNRTVRQEISGTVGERVIFIDKNNQVLEAVYPVQFHTGEIERLRRQFEDQGVLKGIAHIAAEHLGETGPRVTTVEYLPDGSWYGINYIPTQMHWGGDFQDALAKTRALLGQGEENDTED